MIAYFDTSAFLPLLVEEPSTPACELLWRSAESVVTVRLLYVEVAAALHRARRLDRISTAALRRGRRGLDRQWEAFDIVEMGEDLMRSAAAYAGSEALRGYDAMHCAAAVSVLSAVDVAATGDRRLLEAWQHLGIATFDING